MSTEDKKMWTIKYCGSWNYRPQAESLSAQINQHFPDTCEIEEGATGQFELFRNGEPFLKNIGRFIEFEDVKEKLLVEGHKLFTTR